MSPCQRGSARERELGAPRVDALTLNSFRTELRQVGGSGWESNLPTTSTQRQSVASILVHVDRYFVGV